MPMYCFYNQVNLVLFWTELDSWFKIVTSFTYTCSTQRWLVNWCYKKLNWVDFHLCHLQHQAMIDEFFCFVFLLYQKQTYLFQDKGWGYMSGIWCEGHSNISPHSQGLGCCTLFWPAEHHHHNFANSLQMHPTSPTCHPPEINKAKKQAQWLIIQI